jgi:hypothetical protein
MKKIKLIIFAIVFGLLFYPVSTKGAFGVSVGDIYNYTVKTSRWNITHGSNTGSVEKYRLFLDPYNVGTSFNINVTNVLADSVEYDIITSSTTYSWHDEMSTFQIYFVLFLFLPYLNADYVTSGWPTWELENGLSLPINYFYDTDSSTFDYFNNWETTSILTEYSTNSGWEYTHIEAYFDTSGKYAIFDWIIEGALVYTSPDDIDISGYYQLKLVFDVFSGVLQGYRYETNFKGSVEGENYESESEQEVHLTGYSVPDYYFTTTGKYVPGFKWYIPILVFNSLIIISIVIKSHK